MRNCIHSYFFLFACIFVVHLTSQVGVAPGCGLDGRVLARERNLYFLRNVQTGSGVRLISSTLGTGDFFPEGKASEA